MAFRDLYARHDEDLRRPAVSRRYTREVGAGDAPAGSLLSILWHRKLLIAGVMGLSLLGGIIYIAVTPSRYLASTSMLIDPRLGKAIGFDPVQPGFVVDTGAIDSQIKLFTSQTVLSRVAKMADLKNDPEFNGSERSFLQRLLHPQSGTDGDVDLKALEQAITIKRPERTYVVGIDVLARDPKKAAEIANDLTQAYIEDQVGARIDAAQDDTKYVRQQLTRLSAEIKEAQEKVEAFKTKNNIVDTSGLRSNEQQVADLTRSLGDARAKASSAKAKLEEIQRMQRLGHLDASSEAVTSITIERLRQQQAETAQTAAKLAMTLGPRHPELVEARGREAKIEKLIREELRRLALSAAADYESAHRNETQILAEVNRLKTQSTQISRDLVPLAQLERNVQSLRVSYDKFALIRDNLGQQQADSPPGRVIAVARPPVSPAQPRKTVVGIVSLAAGLFLGLAAALFADATSYAPRREREPTSVVYDAPPSPAPAPTPARPRPRSSYRYWDDDDDVRV